jgi:cytoskeletal protein CcmA (bactofilin family)
MLTLLRRLFAVGTDAAPEENFFISSGLEFYGDLVARASSGRIEGKFDGHIIECRKLIIGPHATIKGNVFAEEIVVYGYCEGNLYAAGDMKVFDTAVILGDIHASSLIVEHNATFRGNLRKLRTEDFLEITAREKEKIIQQRKSNVYNIHSLNARLEAEQRKARKVANGMPLTPETEERANAPLKRIQPASPIVVPQQILAPTAVATGVEMPRAINIQASPVDVSTLSGGSADFLVPTMDEAFLPDYVVPLPIVHPASEPESKLPETEVPSIGADNKLDTEPSASMLLLEAELAATAAEVTEEIEEVAEVSEVEQIDTRAEETEIDIESVEMVDTITETDAVIEASTEVELTTDLIVEEEEMMESGDVEAMLDAQTEADESWIEATETEAITSIETGATTTIAEIVTDEAMFMEEISADIAADEFEGLHEDIEEMNTEETAEEPMVQADNGFSFPTSISTSFEPFTLDQNDNGIRIDPSIPFIRIPEPAPRMDDLQADSTPLESEIRASFYETPVSEAPAFVTGETLEIPMAQASTEEIRVKITPAKTMIPRQLSSPEAFELREDSGTMIVIREEGEDMIEEEDNVDRRQQGGPELRGSEPLENDEPKFKISAVPTAEPGYEPGYTNQQRTTRKPVTAQPENTRRWF